MKHRTPNVNSVALAQALQERKFDRKQVRELADMQVWYEDELRRMQREHPRTPWNIAATIHAKMDEDCTDTKANVPDSAARISCREGCAHCCQIQVGITEPEAVLLHLVAREQGIELDEARLKRQAACNPKSWTQQPEEDRRCVFLGADNRCRAYEWRPMACRKYFVISPPAKCDTTDRTNDGKVWHFVSWPAEIVFSAALAVFENGNMASMLLKHKPRSE